MCLCAFAFAHVLAWARTFVHTCTLAPLHVHICAICAHALFALDAQVSLPMRARARAYTHVCVCVCMRALLACVFA